MKLDRNDLAFLDESDFKEYTILKTESSKPQINRYVKDNYFPGTGCFSLLYFGFYFYLFWSIFGHPDRFLTFKACLSIAFTIILLLGSIAVVDVNRKKKKNSFFLRKQIQRLKLLEATYIPKEAKIRKIINDYVQEISPRVGQKILASTSKGNTLEESEIKAFSENLNAYKDNIEYITRANLAFIHDTSLVRYLEHAKMVSDKADRFLSNSQQFIPSKKKISEKIESEETDTLKDENKLVEEQYPNTEQKNY